MPFSKFDPHRLVDDDPLAASSDSARRRAWVLKWGMVVTQSMVLIGVAVILSQIDNSAFQLGFIALGGYWFGQLLRMIGLSSLWAYVITAVLAGALIAWYVLG